MTKNVNVTACETKDKKQTEVILDETMYSLMVFQTPTLDEINTEQFNRMIQKDITNRNQENIFH